MKTTQSKKLLKEAFGRVVIKHRTRAKISDLKSRASCIRAVHLGELLTNISTPGANFSVIIDSQVEF